MVEKQSPILTVGAHDDGAFYVGQMSILGSGKIILPPR
jgi:hypothetical protein